MWRNGDRLTQELDRRGVLHNLPVSARISECHPFSNQEEESCNLGMEPARWLAWARYHPVRALSHQAITAIPRGTPRWQVRVPSRFGESNGTVHAQRGLIIHPEACRETLHERPCDLYVLYAIGTKGRWASSQRYGLKPASASAKSLVRLATNLVGTLLILCPMCHAHGYATRRRWNR